MKKIQTYLFIISLIIPSAQVFSQAENELKDIPPGFNLMPGMKVSGKFRVGQRRLITYFIYPLIRTLGNSFAEP